MLSKYAEVIQVFQQFFLLGFTSFGGPAAHLGYFQQRFVSQLGWLNQAHYAQLVALSQFLPGPGSSQVGFAIGLHKAGLAGGLAAFVAFTLPSFGLMFLLAVIGGGFASQAWYAGAVIGLKLLAIVVVADAVYSMFSNFCQQLKTRIIFVLSLVALLAFSVLWLQIALIAAAGIAGALWIKLDKPEASSNLGEGSVNRWAMALFLLLLMGLPLLTSWSSMLGFFGDYYIAGSLVFGGGHVVLPLLQQQVADTVGTDAFLTGYAAAQAVPGPMFTFATYLGAQSLPDLPLWGAVVATIGVFAPGLLLVLALKDKWLSLANHNKFSGAVAGVNAAVVGLLAATLYQPLVTSTIYSFVDVLLVLGGWLVLKQFKPPILLLVATFLFVGAVFYSS